MIPSVARPVRLTVALRCGEVALLVAAVSACAITPAVSSAVIDSPSVWALRWDLLLAITLVGLQGLMIALLIAQRARRREMEARNVAILKAVPDMMFLFDREGVYVDFHAPDRNLLLLPPERFLGKHMRDVLPPELATKFEERFARLVPGQASEIIEYSLPMPDGDRYYEARIVPVPGHRVLSIVRDITERARAEAALLEAQVQLRRASQLSALGEFAATISHEVRQPLTAIIMSARSSLLEIDAAAPHVDDVRAGLLDIVEAGQRAEEVLQRNRRLFRDHMVQAVPLDINGVIREALVLVATRLRDSQVTLVAALADDLPTIAGDRIELQQVLLNLLANAIDALEPRERESRRVQVSSSLGDDRAVRVAVMDNGVGLRDVNVQQIFTLSYTTKASGTGVGLSISKSIIEAHNGRLWAEENPEGGATFWFSVPVGSTATAAQPG